MRSYDALYKQLANKGHHISYMVKFKYLWLFLIFLLALIIRVSYLYLAEPIPFSNILILDAQAEDNLGHEISAGDWGKIASTGSLYAYFLGIVYAVFGHNLWYVKIIQAVMDSGTCVILYFIGSIIFNPAAGLAASLLSALYGPFIYYNGLIQKTTLTLFLAALFLFAALTAIEAPDKKRWFFSGLFLWLAAMTRWNVLLFVPTIVFWYLLFAKNPSLLIKRAVFMLCFIGGVLLVSLPIVIKNLAYENTFTLPLPSAGLNFYIGNNPNAAGVHTPIGPVRTIPEKEGGDAARIASMETGRMLTPSEVDDFWFKKGMDFARQEPLKFLKLWGRKFLLFWNYYEVPDVYNYYFFREAVPFLNLFLTFGLIAPLGITGMILQFREHRRGHILIGFVLVYMMSLVVLYITSRYRIPAVLMLFPFASYTLVGIADHLKAKAYKRLFFTALILAPVGIAVNWDILDKNAFLSQTHSSLGNIYHEEKKADMAMIEYQAALKIDSNNWTAANNLAYVYAEKGVELNKALQLAMQAVRANPKSPDFLDTLSYVYLKMGKVHDAGDAAIKSLSIDPNNPELIKRLHEIENRSANNL